MDAFQILSIVSCVLSAITTIAICLAILPHIKQGMVLVRDAVLWTVFILILFGGAWFGFVYVNSQETEPQELFKPIIQPVDSKDYYAGK